MEDIKKILISIRDVLLELKEEQERANDLKEVELGVESRIRYRTDRDTKRIKKREKSVDE